MTSGHYCDGCAQAYYKCVCDKQEEKNIPKRMNEQIDKLLIEAGAHFGGDGVVYDTFDPKKFAELIVLKCADIINHRADTCSDWLDSVKANEAVREGQRECAKTIKEHFGVEE